MAISIIILRAGNAGRSSKRKMKKENLTLDLKEPKRVIVYIDGNNLFHRMWEYYNTHRIDILELSKTLCCVNRQLIKINYYYSPFIREINERMALLQQAYVADMSKNSRICMYEGKYIKKKIVLKKDVFMKIRDIISPSDLAGYVEKGIDTKIAVDMIGEGVDKKYDTAILVSTDSDFVPVINYLKSKHIQIQAAAFQDDSHSCYDLKNACGRSFINLHHYIPSTLKKQKSRQNDGFF